MSFLATLFSQSRFERKPRKTASRREIVSSQEKVYRGASTLFRQRKVYTHSLSASEQLEPRIALSVSTIDTERLAENVDNLGVLNHTGRVLIASDEGSDVFLQQTATTPSALFISDNSSFVDKDILEDVNLRFDEIFVTNGATISKETNGEIIPSAWWAFPSPDDPTERTATKLALNSNQIETGPTSVGARGVADFFGTIKIMQGDGTLSTWTFSAWDGSGSSTNDFVQAPNNQGISRPLNITGGVGYGGVAESFVNPVVTPQQGLEPGYIFPKNVRIESLGGNAGNSLRRNYLVCDWSQQPTTPPVMEANYVGYGGTRRVSFTTVYDGTIDYRIGSVPTVGIATQTQRLSAPLPQALAGRSSDGSVSLGVVPGTLSGNLIIGPKGGEEFSIAFQDRKNDDNRTGYDEEEYTLFFEEISDIDPISPNVKQYGQIRRETSPGAFETLDGDFTGSRYTWTNTGIIGTNSFSAYAFATTRVQGRVRDLSVVEFRIGSYLNVGGLAPGYETTFSPASNVDLSAVRALDGVNVPIRELDIRHGNATSAVRLKDVEFLVFVKPTTPNDVVFAPGSTVTRNVTVDLLSDGSSVRVESPINITDPDGDIDFRATNVYVNAATTTQDFVFIGRSESTQAPRLPRVTDPQGGPQFTPTFGTVISNEAQEISVSAVPILNADTIDRLVVLPGDEGYGYDPISPPNVTIELPEVATATADILTVSGGVSDILLGSTGSGYGPSGELPVSFSAPQLRRLEEIRQFSSSPIAEGYSAAPVIAISQPEVVESSGRIGYGERARAQAARGDGIVIEMTDGGANYSDEPNFVLQRTQAAKNANIPLFDPSIPTIFASEFAIPTITPAMEYKAKVVVGTGKTPPPTQVTYQSGVVDSITVTSAGFGINLQGLDPNSVTFLDQLNERFEIAVTGGIRPNETGMVVTNTSPDTGPNTYTIGKTDVKNNFPTQDDVVHATVEITEAFLGGLRWQNNVTGNVPFSNAGSNYELSPSVQAVTKLSANIATEVTAKNFGNAAARLHDTSIDSLAGNSLSAATHKVSLTAVQAFRDDLSPEVTNRFSKGSFRDIDYLSYLDDPLFENNLVARLSADGQSFYSVTIEPFTGLDGSFKNVDELTGQVGFAADPNETYPEEFSEFINNITEVNIYFDESFVGLQLDASADLFSLTGTDSARGRAVSSNGQITFIEVTYPGSGYTQVPTASIGIQGQGTGATATPIVSGGVYEMSLTTAGSNYPADEVPGSLTTVFDNSELDIFEGSPGLGQQNPFVNFSVLNRAIQGGNIIAPGSGLQIASNGLTGFQSEDVGITGNIEFVPPTELAEFEAVIDSSGIIRSFEAVRTGAIDSVEITNGGSGYDALNPPTVIFDSAPNGGVTATGTAIVEFGVVVGIDIVNPGSGYVTTPNIEIAQPAQSNGINATATAIPGRKNGIGYASGVSVSVDPPPSATDASAVAIINASLGVVDSITVVESGLRYKVPPQVTIRPPNPRGEGVAARAEAVLNEAGSIKEIVVIDGGSGYSAPPEVLVEKRFDFSRSEHVDIAAEINADKYEIYLTHSDWTERNRGQLLVRPQAVLGNNGQPNGRSEYIYFEASSSDLIVEGDFKADEIIMLMQSKEEMEMLAPFTTTTRSRATGQQSGTIHANTMAITLGNDIPTSQVGSSLINIFDVRTEIDRLRVTAGESVTDPRGAFPYALSVTENDSLIVDAVPRSGGPIAFDVRDTLSIEAAVRTDSDVSIRANNFKQSSPVITRSGSITIEATDLAIRNSLQVLAAPLDDDRVDISLTATNGAVDLEGLVEAPNAIEIRQIDVSGASGVGGASRLSAGRLRIQADGSIDLATDVESAVASSEFGGISISERDDIRFTNLSASNGTISLEAMGVDLGAEADNPIALSARILAANAIVASAPNGSMDVRVDSSDDIDLGLEFTLVNGRSTASGSAQLGTNNKTGDANGQVAGVELVSTGSSYVPNSRDVQVTFSAPPIATDATKVNVRAEGFAVTDGEGKVVRVNITESGSGYANPPTVTFANPTYESVMQAGGNVRIVNSAGSIDLFDGPVAAASARQVRVATTGELALRSTYQGNTPGAFPSTISGSGALGDIDGVAVEIGDRVLVKNQVDNRKTDRFDERRENGVYVVTRLGGGVGGYQDWLLTRADSADTRDDFLPGSFVRVTDGVTQEGSVFQVSYSNVPELKVTRTENNQLVVAGSTGGLLNLNQNDTVAGPGIAPGARVTGIDFEHGVVTLGVGNEIEVHNVAGPSNGLYSLTVQNGAQKAEYLLEAIQAAQSRGETVLVTGAGLTVGASVQGASLDSNNDLEITLADSSVTDLTAISRIVLGFITGASGRTVLNPAVRSFLISGDVTTVGDTITLSDNFTNYSSLRLGQLVFGDGVAPNTVITKVFPGAKQVVVSPNGLPRAYTFSESTASVFVSSSSSPYHTEGFDNYLQMPDTFNDFAMLSIGQHVEGSGIQPGAVITGIDPVYRQIGLSSGSVLANSSHSISTVDFKPIQNVEFGMIDQLGTGAVSFGVETFGYGAMQFQNPRVASGLASIIPNSRFGNSVTVNNLNGETEIKPGLLVTGVGLNDGYRVQSYNGRDIALYSATAKAVAGIAPSQTEWLQATITVDDGFNAFAELQNGMTVVGSALESGSVPASVLITHIDEASRTVTLSSNVALNVESLTTGYFIFGQPFKQKFLANGSAKSAISVHAEQSSVTTFIGSENPRQNTRYQVTSEAGGTESGSLASLLEIAQQNRFQRISSIDGENPVVTFHQQVNSIMLDNPLPAIIEKPLTIDGLTDINGDARAAVSIDGRFISETASGAIVTPSDEVDGFVFSGPAADGSVIRGVRVGGFNNGAAIRVESASNVLVDNVDLGRNALGGRAGSDYGVYVTGASDGTTVVNSEIVGAEEAAIRLEREATLTFIVGNKIGSNEIINTVGIEVAGSDARVGANQIYPRLTSGSFFLEQKVYGATLQANSKVVDLDASIIDWNQFTPGLAVVGEGLASGTTIVSVDETSRQLIISKAAQRNISSDGQVMIGHRVQAQNASNTMVLNDSVPLEHVFLGQEIRVVSGQSSTALETARIIAIDRVSRVVKLDSVFQSAAFDASGTRLVEFIPSSENLIEANDQGMVVGLFGNASGSLTTSTNPSDWNVVMESGFNGWQSISPGISVYGEGIPVDTTVVSYDEAIRQINLSKPLDKNISRSPLRFEGGDGLVVLNTTVRDNVNDGIVIGGGKNHRLGQVEEIPVYLSQQAAEAAKQQADEQVLELVSWQMTSSVSVDGVVNVIVPEVTEALLDIVTVVSAVVTTETDSNEVDVPSGVVSELSVGLKVIGNGFEQGTQIESIESVPNDPSVYKVTLSRAMNQTLGGVTARFVNESHSDLNKINVYGSRLGRSVYVESFDVDSERMTLSEKGSVLTNAIMYFGLNKYVALNPYQSAAFSPDLFVEGELSLKADATGIANDVEVTLGSGFSDWSQLSYGLQVSGPLIPAETTVVDWDEGNKTLTLSQPLEGNLAAEVQVQSEHGVPEYTTIETIRAEYRNAQDQLVPGFLALSTPDEGESNPLLIGKAAINEIRIGRRDATSNSIAFNGGYGVTVASLEAPQQTYADILATWTIAGTYFDLDLDRATGRLTYRTNLSGPLDSAIFAKLPINAEQDELFSQFSKTDRYGNQYAIQLPLDGSSPIGPIDPIDPPPIEEGDPPDPEDEIWPGGWF